MGGYKSSAPAPLLIVIGCVCLCLWLGWAALGAGARVDEWVSSSEILIWRISLSSPRGHRQ